MRDIMYLPGSEITSQYNISAEDAARPMHNRIVPECAAADSPTSSAMRQKLRSGINLGVSSDRQEILKLWTRPSARSPTLGRGSEPRKKRRLTAFQTSRSPTQQGREGKFRKTASRAHPKSIRYRCRSLGRDPGSSRFRLFGSLSHVFAWRHGSFRRRRFHVDLRIRCPNLPLPGVLARKGGE